MKIVTLLIALFLLAGAARTMPQTAASAAASPQARDIPSAPAMSENESEEQLVDLIKGKTPVPPRMKPPKPPMEAYKYSAAHEARKKK